MEVMKRRQKQLANPVADAISAFNIAGRVANMGGGAASLPDVSFDGGQVTSDMERGGESIDAMAKRFNELQETPQMQIANSIDSLKYIEDHEQRRALAAPLIQAKMKFQKGV